MVACSASASPSKMASGDNIETIEVIETSLGPTNSAPKVAPVDVSDEGKRNGNRRPSVAFQLSDGVFTCILH